MSEKTSLDMSEDNFVKAVNFTLEREGILSNDQFDKGGETKYGISANAFPTIDIENLSLVKAKELYYIHYWMISGCDKMELPLNMVVFDAAVNEGARTVVKFVQAGVNALGGFLLVDGYSGPMTRRTVQEFDQTKLSEWILGRRLKHYIHIVESDITQVRYLDGWVNRIAILLQEISKL